MCLWLTGFIVLSPVLCPSVVSSDLSLLRKAITAYNTEKHKETLSDGSYRGEEGIMRIRPKVARSFGLKVPMDPDYLKAKELFGESEEYRKRAVEAITTQVKEKSKGEHARRAGDLALLSNRAFCSAQEHLKAYRSRLDPELDERLDKDRCSKLIEELLGECLENTSNNLRDALGLLYNRCDGLSGKTPPLTPENVGFANYVLREFIRNAPGEMLKRFDLDNDRPSKRANPAAGWENIVERRGARYASLLKAVTEKHKKDRYRVDPLLFMALVKRESNFSQNAVSYVGAAGLTQIMPRTAKDLGMKNVFEPPYFRQAVSLLAKERELKHKALTLISRIDEKNKLKSARLARRHMQRSLECGKKRAHLFSRYKRELHDKGNDDRLDATKAIEYGYKYFCRMMKTQKGDISLALASYNAGPHRVKQYKGIPPYAETVAFRNSVLRYYKEYLKGLTDREEHQ